MALMYGGVSQKFKHKVQAVQNKTVKFIKLWPRNMCNFYQNYHFRTLQTEFKQVQLGNVLLQMSRIYASQPTPYIEHNI